MRKTITMAILIGALMVPVAMASAQEESGCDPATQPSCPGAIPPTTIPDVCDPATQPSCEPEACQPTQPSCANVISSTTISIDPVENRPSETPPEASATAIVSVATDYPRRVFGVHPE